MKINQLAFVLEYVDSSIHDTSLLVVHEQLITALAQVAAGEMEALTTVAETRERWIEVQQHLEPRNWSDDQLAVLEMYGARAVLGELAIGRLLDAFVSNFMDAKGVLKSAEALLAETHTVATQVAQLLKGLDPILNDPEPIAEALEGEIISGGLEPDGFFGTLRERLNLSPSRELALESDKPLIPLGAKVAAAAPLILAAAGKAFELYRAYTQIKGSPTTPQAPQQQPNTTTTTTNNVHYNYRHTTIFVDKNMR